MLYFNKTQKPCEDINPTVPDVNNAEKRGILGQDIVLNEIDIDDESDYAGDEENVFASEDYDSLIGEFLLELREKFNLTTAATCFVAEKLNYLLEIDRKTLRKTFFNNLDENIEFNYKAKAVLHVNSPIQRVCERFREEKSLSEFTKSKEFVEPVEINLGWDNVTQKFDSIQCVPIISTLKVLLKHDDVLASILHQNNQENDDRLRNYQDGKAVHRNKLFSPKQNSLQLILYHDYFGTVNPLGNKVVKYRVSALYFVPGNIPAKHRSCLNDINLPLLSPSALVQNMAIRKFYNQYWMVY